MVSIAFFVFAGILIASALAVVFSRNSVHSVLFLILAFFNAAALFLIAGAEFLAMLLVVVYVGAVAVLFLFVVMMMDINPQTQPRLFAFEQFKKTSLDLMTFIGYVVIFFGLFVAIGYGLSYVYSVFAGIIEQPTKLAINEDLPWIAQLPWLSLLYDSALEVRFWIGLVAYFLTWRLTQVIIGSGFLQVASRFINSLPSLMGVAILLIFEFCFLVIQWQSSSMSESLSNSPLPPVDLMNNTAAIGQVLYRDYVYWFQGAGLILLVAMIGAIVLTLRHRKSVKRQNVSDQLKRDPKETVELKKIPLGEGI